ncbi:helix-turn-helix transcriptional regulator [Amycolatopsis sp. OK19-0408]|uniref:Helix-turn-helix transcriptional regulator n=1 Tax=Amycolatopsis iheyensis TaxID=2945988 RepID=A0A9X2SPE0_9PSEU|nr:helix-turn-helix transcriptional regulator [Amycolatopsis iheyensis]MCR6488066.1 helix-turn-helix transcriptional regulator [Amycolatopsis iheyensis]
MATPFATPRARALGFGLRKCREERELGVRELARVIGVHAQEVSSWEYAKRVPRVEQVALVMGALVVEPGERARLLELARTAAEPSWLEKVMPGRKNFTYVQYEREARELFGWEPVLVPGLLQTPAYTRVVLTGLGVPGEMIERQAVSRQARRGLLTGPHPIPFAAIVGEAVLRPGFVEPAPMAEQLRLLLELSRRPNISLRVLRGSPVCHPGLCGPFVILDFEQLPPIVFVEQYRASAYLYADDQVADYRAAAGTLAALALSEHDSRVLIGEVIADLGGSDG